MAKVKQPSSIYCIYLRKSRADLELEAKGELETLARHKKTLLGLAKKMNITIGQIYEEIVSGETIEARPIVQQLIGEVEQGQWAGVLVMEIERLARGDTIDQGVVSRAFKLGHTKIITPIKSYDPDNEFDEEYFEFGLYMSRREYKTITRRIQRGRIASANEGKFLGSTPPYGYNKIRIEGDKGYTLSPDPEESKVVALIYKLYIQGNGMEVIARKLDELNIKPRNRETWSKSTINDILKNPVYLGKLRWSYRKEVKYMLDGKMHKRRSKNDNPIYVDGRHPAIITEDDFSHAQAIRKKNTYKKTKNELTLQNPLSGLVYCKLCGRMMTRIGNGRRNKYPTLRCPNRHCDNVSAPVFMVEQKIISTIKKWLQEYSVEVNVEQITNDISLNKNALETINRELEKVDLQITNTYDLLEQGVYTVDLFTERNKALAEKRASLVSKAENLEQTIKSAEESKILTYEQIPRISGILESYHPDMAAEEKNAILRRLIKKAEYIKTSVNTKGNILNSNFEIHLYPNLPNK